MAVELRQMGVHYTESSSKW